jgi:hypothetical protein
MVSGLPVLLFLFLPIVLSVYLVLLALRARNAWVLVFSRVFYARGELVFVFPALSIFCFPQPIASPILRWRNLAPRLVDRAVTGAKFEQAGQLP